MQIVIDILKRAYESCKKTCNDEEIIDELAGRTTKIYEEGVF